MSTNKFLLLLFFVTLLFSCKSDTSTSDQKAESDKSEQTLIDQAAAARDRAINTIDYRRKNVENKSYRTMDNGILVYEAIFDPKIKQLPMPTEGKWIDFHSDFTYEYGTYGEKEGSGTYYYLFSDQLLLMVDDDPTQIPEEYEVKVSGTAQVWVGKNTYSNNGKQIKLVKADKIPSK